MLVHSPSVWGLIARLDASLPLSLIGEPGAMAKATVLNCIGGDGEGNCRVSISIETNRTMLPRDCCGE
jgi:hypothetical protein